MICFIDLMMHCNHWDLFKILLIGLVIQLLYWLNACWNQTCYSFRAVFVSWVSDVHILHEVWAFNNL